MCKVNLSKTPTNEGLKSALEQVGLKINLKLEKLLFGVLQFPPPLYVSNFSDEYIATDTKVFRLVILRIAYLIPTPFMYVVFQNLVL